MERNAKGQFMKGHMPSIPFKKGQIPWNKGIPCTEETKNKISQLLKGNTIRVGTKHTEETKKKISETHKGKRKGKDSPHWKGGDIEKKCLECNKNFIVSRSRENSGKNKFCCRDCFREYSDNGLTEEHTRIRNSIEMRLWREAVFARDGYTCQKTGVKGDFNAHHICNFADYPELRTSIENGVTLSIKAHIEFHKIYGRKNNTREQLEEFLNI